MRTRNVVQLHLANKFAIFGMPFIIMGSSFAIVIIIGIIAQIATGGVGLDDMYTGMLWNGAIFAMLGPLMGFGFTAMGQYFALATGLGITRREFAAGTSVVFLGNAAMFAIVTGVGKIIEVATGGWGLQVRFFDVVYTGAGPAWQTFVQTFLIVATVSFVGAAIMTGVLRFGQTFLWTLGGAFSGLIVLVLGTAMLNSAFAAWLGSLLSMGWMGWMAVILGIGLIGAAAWLVLVRRAQAR